MARSTRRKYWKRKSGRWAPNIVKIRERFTPPPGEFGVNAVLCFNPVYNSGTVSQVYTAKNFEITFTLEAGTSQALANIEGVCIYIMYVPQGMTVDHNYYANHPEYILNYKYIGSPTTQQFDTSGENQQYQPIRVRSRMARKLQTGDQIILYINGTNSATSDTILDIDGIVRWWTKAN